jgi:AcrR family transcriptional regulator
VAARRRRDPRISSSSAKAPRYHFIDHVIDETVPRRPTRAEQRAATRQALIDATATCLVEEGYAALTTRRVAELAGVAQSTLMHHFETREALLAAAVEQLAMRLAEQALDEIDLAALHRPERREAVLDQAWREFTSPQALAAAQLWIAAWSEPELADTLRDLERRIESILGATGAALFPEHAEDPRFPALIAAAVAVIQGLVMEIPIAGRKAVDARWRAIKPVLIEAAGRLLDS